MPKSTVVLTCGADLTPEPVQWLWPDWLALSKFHLLARAPGQGKTTIAMGMAATVTIGGRWSDGSQCAAGNVLIWSGEDDYTDTLLPRLIAAYELRGEEKPMYPDFLVVRKDGDNHIVDILEPHSPALSDNYAKAKGLAQFAAKHSSDFGRIQLIRLVGKEIKRLDLIDEATRMMVLKVDSDAGLDLVFDIVNA